MNYRTSIRALFEAVVTENKKKIEALADKGNKRAQDYIRGRGYAKQQGVDHAKAHGTSDWATGVRSRARDREQAMAGGKSLALIGAQRISHNERPLVINTKPTGPTYRLGSSGVSKMDKGYLEREGRRSVRAYTRDKGARPNQPSEEERYLPKQEENIMDYRTSIRALFEAVLLERENLSETNRRTKDFIKNVAGEREAEAYKSDATDRAEKMAALAGRHGPKGGTGANSLQASWVRNSRKASNKGKTPEEVAQDNKRTRAATAKYPELRR